MGADYKKSSEDFENGTGNFDLTYRHNQRPRYDDLLVLSLDYFFLFLSQNLYFDHQ